MLKSKRLLAGAAAVCAALLVPAAVVPAFAEDETQVGLKIGDKLYSTAEELKQVTDGESEIVTDGAVIEVYGKVDLPLHTENQPELPTAHGRYVWYLGGDNVQVVGKTEDAALMCTTDANGADVGGAQGMGGMWGRQSLIIVAGDNASFEDVALYPNYNTYNAPNNTNKTVEVMAENFTIKGCTFVPLNEETAKTLDSGVLYLNGDKGTVVVEGNTFNKGLICFDSVDEAEDIQIVGNTFDTPTYDAETEEYGYFISQTSWATPRVTAVADAEIRGNTFKNMPEDYSKAVLMRAEGSWTLVDNTADDGRSMTELVSFAEREGVTFEMLSENALVTVVENGKTTEARVDAEGEIDTEVTNVAVSEVKLDKATLELLVGETATLTATVSPEDATDKTVVWSSSDEKIAKVENGKVTAVAEGEAVITVKAGDKTATCKVTVVKDTGTGVASAAPAVAVLAVLSAVAVAGVCLKKRRG